MACGATSTKLRERLETEVRGDFPDLPSTETISQAVRSPLSFLDNLAECHHRERARHPERSTPPNFPMCTGRHPALGRVQLRPAGTEKAAEEPPAIPGVLIADPGGIVHQSGPRATLPDDPAKK